METPNTQSNQSQADNQLTPYTPAPDAIISKAKEQSLAFMNPERWRTMTAMAEVFVKSSALPSGMNNAPKVIMAMQAGYEAGMQPLEALNSFYFVNGKLSMYGEMGIALVRKAGHRIDFNGSNDEQGVCEITRGDTGEKLKNVFTMEMANKRGLTGNSAYKKNPANMLRFRAFWDTARFLVPDALHGVPLAEVVETEIDDTPKDDGAKEPPKKAEVIDAGEHKSLGEELKEAETIEVIPPAEEEKKPKPKTTKAKPKADKQKNADEGMTAEEVAEEMGGEVIDEEESPAKKAMRAGMAQAKEKSKQ